MKSSIRDIGIKSGLYALIALGVIMGIFFICMNVEKSQENAELKKSCTEVIVGTVQKSLDYRRSKKVSILYEINGEAKKTPEIEDKYNKFRNATVYIHYNPDDLSEFYFGDKPDPAFPENAYSMLVFALIGMVASIVILVRMRINGDSY